MLGDDLIDLGHGSGIDAPAQHILHWIELVRVSGAPEGNRIRRPIKHPAQRQMNHPLAKVLLCKPIERGYGRQIFGKVRRLKFRIGVAA